MEMILGLKNPNTPGQNSYDPTGSYMGNMINPATADQFQAARNQQAMLGLAQGFGARGIGMTFGDSLTSGLAGMQASQNALIPQALQAAQANQALSSGQLSRTQAASVLQEMGFLDDAYQNKRQFYDGVDAGRAAARASGAAPNLNAGSPTGSMVAGSPNLVRATGTVGPLATVAMDEFKKNGASDAFIRAALAHGQAEGGFFDPWKQAVSGENSFGHWQLNKNGELPGYQEVAGNDTDTRAQARYLMTRMEQEVPGITKTDNVNHAMDSITSKFERYKGHGPGQRREFLAKIDNWMGNPVTGTQGGPSGATGPQQATAPPTAAPPPLTPSGQAPQVAGGRNAANTISVPPPPGSSGAFNMAEGDSIGVGFWKHGQLAGNPVGGRNPQQVYDNIQGNLQRNPGYYKGQNVILSTGTMNDPKGTYHDLIPQQIRAIQEAGGNVILSGADPYHFPERNAMIASMAATAGVPFVGALIGTTPKDIHPSPQGYRTYLQNGTKMLGGGGSGSSGPAPLPPGAGSDEVSPPVSGPPVVGGIVPNAMSMSGISPGDLKQLTALSNSSLLGRAAGGAPSPESSFLSGVSPGAAGGGTAVAGPPSAAPDAATDFAAQLASLGTPGARAASLGGGPPPPSGLGAPVAPQETQTADARRPVMPVPVPSPVPPPASGAPAGGVGAGATGVPGQLPGTYGTTPEGYQTYTPTPMNTMPLPPGVTQQQLNAGLFSNSIMSMLKRPVDSYIEALGKYGPEVAADVYKKQSEAQIKVLTEGMIARNKAVGEGQGKASYDMIEVPFPDGTKAPIPRAVVEMGPNYVHAYREGSWPAVAVLAQKGAPPGTFGGQLGQPQYEPKEITIEMPDGSKQKGFLNPSNGVFTPGTAAQAPGAAPGTAGAPLQVTPPTATKAETERKAFSIYPPQGTGPGYTTDAIEEYSPEHPNKTTVPAVNSHGVVERGSQADRDKTLEEYRADGKNITGAFSQVQQAEQYMLRLGELLKTVESGKFAQNKAEIYRTLNGLGIKVQGNETAAQVQELLKTNFQNTLATTGQTKGLQRITEKLVFMANQNFTNPDLEPAANFRITSEGLARVQQSMALVRDWNKYSAEGMPWNGMDPEKFMNQWYMKKDNSLADFNDRARAQLGPYKGMSHGQLIEHLPHFDSVEAAKTAGYQPGWSVVINGVPGKLQ